MEPNWLSAEQFMAAVALAFPGLHLIRADSLAAALHAPRTAFVYDGEAEIFVLAGLYAERVAKAHAFADGNKRCALLAATTFLGINKVDIDPPQNALAVWVQKLADGSYTAELFGRSIAAYAHYGRD